MKKFALTICGLGILAVAGCTTTTHETRVVHAEPTVVRETTVIEKSAPTTVTTETKTVVVNPHRAWWERYHSDEPFDGDRARALHRSWCVENSADTSCVGWN
jgi:hypothetical protein